MNLSPTQSTLQAFGNSVSQTAPVAQTKLPVNAQPADQPAPNATQRADAAPRIEAPARPEPDERSSSSPSAQDGRRASKVDILV